MPRIDERAASLMVGAFDLHVHTAPDAYAARVQDDIEFAQDAADHQMRGCVLKNHETMTVDRAAIVRKFVEDFDCFGGICLDSPVGGLNPYAVEAALGFRGDVQLCRIIWMPTSTAFGYPHKSGSEPGKTWSILDEDGALRTEVKQIFEIIRAHGCALATGHLRVIEQQAMVHGAHEMGLEKLIVTHADAPAVGIPLEVQIELSAFAYIEHSAVHSLPTNAGISLKKVVADIAAVGAHRCFLSSDLGQDFNPAPVTGLHSYVSGLLREGIKDEDMRQMLVTNPGYLVG